MKKTLIYILAICILLALAAVIFYRFYAPRLVAEALTQDELPAYVPEAVKKKIRKYKEPVNDAATSLLTETRSANIPIEQVTNSIANISKSDLDAIATELSNTDIQNTNQVFDIIKDSWKTEFELELLRESFNENINLTMIQKAIDSYNRDSTKQLDVEMMKSLFTNVLIQKNAEIEQQIK